MSNLHTCNYCDGTLHSVRLICGKCGHALCGQLYPFKEIYVEYILGFFPKEHVKFSGYNTTCPKCHAVNTLDEGVSKVVHAYVI